ncbi:hypothetical protein [Aeromonas veronii]|uniref:hypothetical protein n=1 Tax=Aeromonas veronii TaxID=654 RepID=UPI000E1F66CD|nr:hypothetical protein [Aeromonas veronii]RDU82288.1 hypothetical protein CHF44_10150 [Aeromonas veronii]RDU92959.1 hypothetical protein CHH34_08385 [Aeromonas veronii]TEY65696.1 hypothetical protein CIG15_07880 [Aeromonas veronii]
MFRLMTGALLAIMLSGCAAMFNGTSQQVSIRSQDPDAEIYVNDMLLGHGNVITSFKKKENYTITVKSADCYSVTVPVSKSFDATTLLGIFVDLGVVSILVVDGVGTGAWQKFDQNAFIVDPICKKA